MQLNLPRQLAITQSEVLLGGGGFGAVYRGTVRGSLDVAVKVLTQVRQN